MATAKTAKKTAAKKPAAKKTTAKKAAPKKAAVSSTTTTFRDTAERAVHVYLGVIGKGVDALQENLESARKDRQKRIKELEKRGAKLRKELEKRADKFEAPKFDSVVEDAKEQMNKVQEQVEDAVESMKDRLTPAKAA